MTGLAGITALQDACTTFLSEIIATFAALTPAVGLPARQLVTVAQPAGDTEQLAVFVGRVYPGQPGQEESRPQPCGGPLVAEIIAELWRCHPTSEGVALTTAAEETAAAAARHADLLLLIEAADATARTLDLDGEAVTGGGAIIAPGGALAGTRALLAIPVPRG